MHHADAHEREDASTRAMTRTSMYKSWKGLVYSIGIEGIVQNGLEMNTECNTGHAAECAKSNHERRQKFDQLNRSRNVQKWSTSRTRHGIGAFSSHEWCEVSNAASPYVASPDRPGIFTIECAGLP
mmetsp:Transcript_5506/g.16921  ORF Transcript_5506/g.16921 Transcript_5506/m.16921 type:complete len:126 (+) Transcript_5506:471-848(+)